MNARAIRIALARGLPPSACSENQTEPRIQAIVTPGERRIRVAYSLLLCTLASCETQPIEPALDPVAAPQSSVMATGADLALAVMAPSEALVGQRVSYTFTVTNEGPDVAANVVLAADLPEGALPAGLSGAGCAFVGSPWSGFECVTASLAAGDSLVFRADMYVDVLGAATLTAVVAADTPDPDASDNGVAPVVVINASAADAAVFVNPPLRTLVGQSTTFQLNIANRGPDLIYLPMTATVEFSADLVMPPSVSFSGGTICSLDPGSFSCSGGNPRVICAYPGSTGARSLTCRVSDRRGIGPGNFGFGTALIHVTSSAAGTATLSAMLHEIPLILDPDAVNNTSIAQTLVFDGAFPPMADLRLTKTAPASAQPGQSFDYTLAVRNQGPDAAENVVLTDVLPAGLNLNSTSGALCAGTTTVVCQLGTLTQFQQTTVTMTVSSAQEGTVVNTASVASDAADHEPDNDQATATTDIRVPTADLEIHSVSGPASAELDRSFDISWRVTNHGPDNATSTEVVGTLPTGMGYASGSTGCSATTGGFRCFVGNLNAGRSLLHTVTLRSTVLGPQEVLLMAKSAQQQPDPDRATASHPVIIVPRPSTDLSTVISGPAELLLDEELVFTVTVENHGPDAPSGVNLNTFLLASAFGDVAWTPSLGQCNMSVGSAVDADGNPLIAVACDHSGLPSGASWVVEVRATAAAAGVFTVLARASSNLSDPDATNDDDSFELTVRVPDAEPPLVWGAIADPNPVANGNATTLTAVASDAGHGDSNIIAGEYSTDGGATWRALAAIQPVVGLTLSQALNPPTGVHELCMRATDAAGNTSLPACTLLAAYDPDGGFVTGGGWIDSPAGAYVADAAVAGKAHFAFVSRYERGAGVPTGHTQFRFQAAGLDFRSASYEWLVVAGARAQFKGIGEINGEGDYGFLITAIDGSVSGGGGTDRLRVKVWDRSSGALVYDNQVGGDTDDDATPQTVLGGGNITISAPPRGG